jgi:hypothetical protein
MYKIRHWINHFLREFAIWISQNFGRIVTNSGAAAAVPNVAPMGRYVKTSILKHSV